MGSSGEDDSLTSFGANVGRQPSLLSRSQDWILVKADRLFVAAVISVATFFLFLGLGELGVISFVNDDSITRLAGGMIAGTFSLVTLVVSINQLILSREFTAAGEAREQLEGVLSFREEVAEVSSVPASPASPTRLLELLVAAIYDRATDLEEVAEDHDDDVREVIQQYVEDVTESTEHIDRVLKESTFGTFSTVSATISYDESWHLYVAEHLRERHSDELSEEAHESLENLIEAFKMLDIAREHFKTTYLQRELTRFSQLTIYCGVPAILAAMLIGFVYGDITGPSISVVYLPFVVSGLIAVVVSPLALLTAFILRTATLTRRTASTGPMVPQKNPEEGPFDVEYGDDDSRPASAHSE
ncbi:hypothetical protein [Natrononativus amylolyticus]|uniref:hypothetical protein n=1 Tax=Natrononativus amylolyticus TaxID=2963434 RepID=UPI0020CF2A1D|nr:hypothetical protein [Natrononativus amylolyticus]